MNLRRIASALALAVLVVLSAQPHAAARGHDDVRRKREEVRQRKAKVAADVDVLRAEDVELERALDAINRHVDAQQAQLRAAQAAVARAERAVVDARAAQATAAAEADRLRRRLKDGAVSAYVSGPTGQTEAVLAARDLNEASRRAAFIDIALRTVGEDRDALRSALEDLTDATARAADEAARAQEQRQAVGAKLAELQSSQDRQEAFASRVEERLEARLAEAASIEQLDAQLSAEIVRRQQSLASRNRNLRRAPSGSAPAPSDVSLRNVRGIWVHESIADNLERLLAAADGDGIGFGGSGYRDPRQQQALREQNCPDPRNSPASSCRPPTARAGQSMHERGLAVDFTYQGRIISSRSSPGYRWLDANAGRFGLRNLPSEPWHWSTNGN